MNRNVYYIHMAWCVASTVHNTCGRLHARIDVVNAITPVAFVSVAMRKRRPHYNPNATVVAVVRVLRQLCSCDMRARQTHGDAQGLWLNIYDSTIMVAHGSSTCVSACVSLLVLRACLRTMIDANVVRIHMSHPRNNDGCCKQKCDPPTCSNNGT